MSKPLIRIAIQFVTFACSVVSHAGAPIFTDDEVIEISARRFSVISRDQSTSTQLDPRTGLGGNYDNNPVISFSLNGPYKGYETMSSIGVGNFSFSETVIDTRTAYPSIFRVWNGGTQVAEFGQGLRLLGGGTIPGPGPGGVSAMNIVSHDKTDSSNVHTGGIVTKGGLGVAKAAHIGGDLAVLGQAFKTNGGSWASISDRRLKKNFSPMQGSLERIQRLTPVAYEWKNSALHSGDVKPAGFIAQEIGEVFPEFLIQANCQGADCELTGGENVNAIALSTGFDGHIVAALKELAKNAASVASEIAKLSGKVVSAKIFAKEARLKRLCVGQTCIEEKEMDRLVQKPQLKSQMKSARVEEN